MCTSLTPDFQFIKALISRCLIAGTMIMMVAVTMGQTAFTVTDAQVDAVHSAALPLDAHVDILMPTTRDGYRTEDGVSQATVEKLRNGGMATVTFALHSPNGPETPEGIAFARNEIDAKLAKIHEIAAANPDDVEIAYSTVDIERITGSGKIAFLVGFQNVWGFGGDASLLDHYVAQGVRVFAFNHAGNNFFADSSRPFVTGDTPNDGLSELGQAAVRRLNDLGVIIDVSQLTPDALLQTITLSRTPVIASHSAVRALVDEPRNLHDYEMQAIAEAGGVIHLPPFNTYTAPRPQEFVQRLQSIRREFGLPPEFRGVLDDVELLQGSQAGAYTGQALAAVPRATLDDYVDKIDYVVNLVGIDHVGFGSDFDHGSRVIGFKDLGEAKNLTRELLERGYSTEDIKKFWSGNFMRVFRAVEEAAEN